MATAGDVTRRRETSGASTSASEPHRPSRVAVEAGRGKGNPLGAPESVPTLAPDALRLTPSQHWLLHWQQQERTQEKWNEGRNPRRALKRQHEHAERQRASRHPSASLPAVVPQDGLNHPGHEASPPVKSSITVGWSEAEHAEGRSITAGDDGDANDGTRRLPRSSDVAARVLRHQSALNLSPTPAPLGLLTPMRSPWESCAVENDSGSSDPSGALDPFRSIFMAAMADTPEFSTVTPSPAGNSATLSRVSAAGQSASAVSTLDALDTLERVCIALQGVEDREAAVARRSGIDAGGSLRRTWALARTSETRVAWARDDALSRSSTPQLQLPHGGRHSFHSRGAEEVVRQVLTGLERVGRGDAARRRDARGSSSFTAASDISLTADEVLNSVLEELEEMDQTSALVSEGTSERRLSTAVDRVLLRLKVLREEKDLQPAVQVLLGVLHHIQESDKADSLPSPEDATSLAAKTLSLSIETAALEEEEEAVVSLKEESKKRELDRLDRQLAAMSTPPFSCLSSVSSIPERISAATSVETIEKGEARRDDSGLESDSDASMVAAAERKTAHKAAARAAREAFLRKGPGSVLDELSLVDVMWDGKIDVATVDARRHRTLLTVPEDEDEEKETSTEKFTSHAVPSAIPLSGVVSIIDGVMEARGEVVTVGLGRDVDKFREAHAAADSALLAAKSVLGGGGMAAAESRPDPLGTSANWDSDPLRAPDEAEDAMKPFEDLPLHFACRSRNLNEEWDFEPLEPPPPPPSAVAAAAIEAAAAAATGVTTTRSVLTAAHMNTLALDVMREDKGDGNDPLASITGGLDALISTLRAREQETARTVRAAEAASEDIERRLATAAAEAATVALGASHRGLAMCNVGAAAAFDAHVRVQTQEVMFDMMESLRWWFAGEVRAAAVKVQALARGWRSRKEARVRRKGLAAGLAMWRHATLCAMFDYWREGAAFSSRHRKLLAVVDAKRVQGKGKCVFRAWADRTAKAKQFRSSVEVLGRALGLRNAAPMFKSWSVAARRNVRVRTRAVALFFRVEGRVLLEAFKTWSENAKALARQRILDVRAHAAALVAIAEALERAETQAHAATSAANNASRLAALGQFAASRAEASLAEEFTVEVEKERREAEKIAKKDAGPNDTIRIRELLSAAHGAVLRAGASAADAMRVSEPDPAADAFRRRSLTLRAFFVWRRHIVDWLRPLRAKAGRAALFFSNNICGRAFYSWHDTWRTAKEQREVKAMRAYIKTYQCLITKHIGRERSRVPPQRRPAGGGDYGNYGFLGQGSRVYQKPKPPVRGMLGPTRERSITALDNGNVPVARVGPSLATRGEDSSAGAIMSDLDAAVGPSKSRYYGEEFGGRYERQVDDPLGYDDYGFTERRGTTSWVDGGVDAWVASTTVMEKFRREDFDNSEFLDEDSLVGESYKVVALPPNTRWSAAGGGGGGGGLQPNYRLRKAAREAVDAAFETFEISHGYNNDGGVYRERVSWDERDGYGRRNSARQMERQSRREEEYDDVSDEEEEEEEEWGYKRDYNEGMDCQRKVGEGFS